MRILFCDDDEMILGTLQQYVFEYFQLLGSNQPEYATYTSGDELLKNENRADIAFLDVEMEGTNGISVGATLKQSNPRIKIFIVTAYPDYLDEAMRFQVFRYLSKPIDKKRLYRNLKDAVYQYNIDSREFPIATNEGVFTRRSEEIICVETSQRKTIIHTTDNTFVSVQNIGNKHLHCHVSTQHTAVLL